MEQTTGGGKFQGEIQDQYRESLLFYIIQIYSYLMEGGEMKCARIFIIFFVLSDPIELYLATYPSQKWVLFLNALFKGAQHLIYVPSGVQ